MYMYHSFFKKYKRNGKSNVLQNEAAYEIVA